MGSSNKDRVLNFKEQVFSVRNFNVRETNLNEQMITFTGFYSYCLPLELKTVPLILFLYHNLCWCYFNSASYFKN